MPVVRGVPSVNVLDPDRRRSLVESLRNEVSGGATPGGPVVYEIPLDQTDKIDVLVVWGEWAGIGSEDRTNVILESYGDQDKRIAQALGVTYEEAVDQQLLPYSVVPMTASR